MSDNEILLRAFDEAGTVAGNVKVILVERADGWYMSIILQVGEPKTIVQGEFADQSYEEALDAAVLRANDAANEHGYTADV